MADKPRNNVPWRTCRRMG